MTEEFKLEDLKKPFAPDELEWRVQSYRMRNNEPNAQVLVYVTARAVFDRLDAVVGPENWKNTQPLPVHGTKTMYKGEKKDWSTGDMVTSYSYDIKSLQNPEAWDTQQGCLLGFNMGISIRVNGEWMERWDGADVTDFEPYKGGISSAWKRAAVPWGIGRYLYDFGNSYADFRNPRAKNSKLGQKISGNWYNWLPPEIKPEHLPEGWSGDQYAHLMRPGFGNSTPAAQTAPAQPEVADQKPSEGLMKKLVSKTTDLRNKASMAQSDEDKQEIRDRVAKAKEFFGQKFGSAEIDKTELDQLTMLLKSVEDTIDA